MAVRLITETFDKVLVKRNPYASQRLTETACIQFSGGMEGGTETNKYIFVKLMGPPLVLKTPLLQRYPFLFHDFAHFIHLGFYVDHLDRVAVAEVCGGSSTRNGPINIIAPSNIQRSEFALSIVDDLLTNELVF